MKAEKTELVKVENLIRQIVMLKNQLQELGVLQGGDQICSDYAKWFCSVKFDLELCDRKKLGYDAFSKFGKRVQIESRLGSDVDFSIRFDIQGDAFDYLLLVFVNESTWMIDSIYKVSHGIVTKFLICDQKSKFEWKRESRSLSEQLYPDEENMLSPVL
ncbi:MAG: hypothetical protein P8Y18_07415 [Candidatus Bathyarchaeota archaeon]